MKKDDLVRVKNPPDARKLAVPVSTRDRRQLALRFRELLGGRDVPPGSTVSTGLGMSGRATTTSDVERPPVPKMHISLLTTGTWGDNVGQFVAIALRLQADGHRVRLATHECFRDRISAAGLEFSPLGGSASTIRNFLRYLESQRNGKRSMFRRALNPEKDFRDFDDLKSLVFSVWPACVEAKPSSPGLQFRADLIISHPLVFGHSVVAARLGVPLHYVCTTPLSRTRAFPPVFNPSEKLEVPFKNTANNASMHDIFDTLVTGGLRQILHAFEKSLNLPSARHRPLLEWQIPHSYLWEESLLPKPSDWGSEVLIAGFVDSGEHNDGAIGNAHHHEEPSIQAFKGEDATPIVYVGFVRDDWDALGREKLLHELETAATDAHVRVLLHVFSSSEARNVQQHRSKTVFEVSSHTSIKSLLSVVAGALHWGDVSILASWLGAGVPSCVIARDSTQRFWGQTLAHARVGVEPIDMEAMSSSILAAAFQRLVGDSNLLESARRVGQLISSDTAVGRVVQHVYDMLPLENMHCDLDPSRIAHIYDPDHELKLSYEAHLVVQSTLQTTNANFVRYHPLKYTPRRAPRPSLCPTRKKKTKKNKRSEPLFTYELPDYRKRPGIFALFRRVSVEEKQRKTKAVPVVDAPLSWSSPDIERLRATEVIEDYAKLLASRF